MVNFLNNGNSMFFSLRDYGKNMEGIVHNRNDAIVSEAALRFLKDELINYCQNSLEI